MKLVRFGSEIINLDLVHSCTITEERVVLYFVGQRTGLNKGEPLVKVYEEEQAKALFNYLLANSEELKAEKSDRPAKRRLLDD